MTHTIVTLESVCFVLPDGSPLLSNVSAQFDRAHTGLVGRNGVGKSVLGRIIAGRQVPAGGRCLQLGSVHYLGQQIAPSADATVASLAGVQPALCALQRIEAGSTDPADFELLNDRWTVRQQLRHQLDMAGLPQLDADTPASQLSGGTAMRVELAGALLCDADLLTLDEPSNHLDQAARLALIEQLRQWPKGLLVISHDRQLLETMDRIVELSERGLRSYGGPYSAYAALKAQERQNAIDEHERSRAVLRRETSALRDQAERQQRRQSQGDRAGKTSNQAKILLGRQKERSEHTAGRLLAQRQMQYAQLQAGVHAAARALDQARPVSLLHQAVAPARTVAELNQVDLPHVTAALRRIDLVVGGQQRMAVAGPNGSGKSTLLKVLAGQIPALAGRVKVTPNTVYLDQGLQNLNPQATVLEQLRAANRLMAESDRRMRLDQLGLGARQINQASELLSGGERLKAALACVLYADPAPQLLLLDEPGNHLDLSATEALEAMLSGYQGALIVVSHDEVFLQNLKLGHRLCATAQGWRSAPC